jgi:protoporphyrinogen oxidase
MTNTQKNKKKYNGTKNYDLVIIGGGISGLYTLYKLSKQFTNLKILLLESGERYGGRIYSYKETIDGEEYVMDLGAGRLGHHQKLINKIEQQIINNTTINNTTTNNNTANNNTVNNNTAHNNTVNNNNTEM